MKRYRAIQSHKPVTWVFWIKKDGDKQTVVSTFFGRYPERSKARKEQLKRRREENVITSGYTSDPIDFNYFVWPDNIQKPIEKV